MWQITLTRPLLTVTYYTINRWFKGQPTRRNTLNKSRHYFNNTKILFFNFIFLHFEKIDILQTGSLPSHLMSFCLMASQISSFRFLVMPGPNLAKRRLWFWRTKLAKVRFWLFVNISVFFSNKNKIKTFILNSNFTFLIRCKSLAGRVSLLLFFLPLSSFTRLNWTWIELKSELCFTILT